MSPYKKTSILSLILIICLCGMVYFFSIPWYIIPAIVVIYLGALVLGASNLQLNFFFQAHHQGPETHKKIALSFDDGPDPEITPQLLELLSSFGATANFFCIGKNIEDNKALLQEMDRNGHIIGNHAYHHANTFSLQSSKKMAAEIEKTNLLIQSSIGKKPLLFRPPFGVSNPMLARAIRFTKMTPIGWSIRSFDTIKKTDKVLRKIKGSIKPGDIILLHDKGPEILNTTALLLEWLKAEQYEAVSLDELLTIDVYEN